MVSQSKPIPPIVSCSLVHAVSLLNTKALIVSSIYSTFFTLDYSRKQQQQLHWALTLETIVALYILIYSIVDSSLQLASGKLKHLDEQTVYVIFII